MNELLTNTYLLIVISLTALSLLWSLGKMIYSFVKKRKAKSEGSEEVVEEEQALPNPFEKLLDIIENVVPKAIEIAEVSGAKTSDSKKSIALSNIVLECINRGVDYKGNFQEINDALERLITMSNKVNINKEHKEVESDEVTTTMSVEGELK